MIYSIKELIQNLIVESLHPELKGVVQSLPVYGKSKQALLSAKIRELSNRGEQTGIEGNMPKGSSRAYLPHKDPEKITIDGKPAEMRTGTKVAIRATLDRYHKGDMSLGAKQNEAEGGDGFVNRHYRVLSEDRRGEFKSNDDYGIFPPLLDHDHDNHQWSHVGHADKISRKRFRELTRTEDFPKGISHDEFCSVLERRWNQNHGKHWNRSEKIEKQMDALEEHPLVQKFMDHQGNTHTPPHDYRQMGNLGEWKHPVTGQSYVVARDHGFSNEVMKAYSEARRNQSRNLREEKEESKMTETPKERARRLVQEAKSNLTEQTVMYSPTTNHKVMVSGNKFAVHGPDGVIKTHGSLNAAEAHIKKVAGGPVKVTDAYHEYKRESPEEN